MNLTRKESLEEIPIQIQLKTGCRGEREAIKYCGTADKELIKLQAVSCVLDWDTSTE